MDSNLKIAISHEWLTIYGGSERVVEEILKIFPQAHIYTTVYNEKNMSKFFPPSIVTPSFIQKIPGAKKHYTKMLSLMPKAFESFDLREYDIVISSNSSCAKGVLTTAETMHVSYLHTPMRYAWDLYFDYLENANPITRHFMKKTIPWIRQWDQLNTARVDHLVANSNTVRRRIKKIYRREADVIFPPVDITRVQQATKSPEDYFFILSRLIPYKRIDLAIEACNKLNKKLVIAGDGPLMKELQKKAGKTIEFVGRVSDEQAAELYQNAKAFLFPGYEDFGITPLEAQAAGRPVIAYGSGGVLDTIQPGKTGVFFPEQSVDSLVEGIKEFEKTDWNSDRIRKHAETFSNERFQSQFKKYVLDRYKVFKS